MQGFGGSDNILVDRVANSGWNLEGMIYGIVVQAWEELMEREECA